MSASRGAVQGRGASIEGEARGPVGLSTRLRDDVEALAAIERPSTGCGERASASLVAGRLQEVGCEGVHTEPYRYQPTFAWSQAAHFSAGLVAAAAGKRALAAAALGSFELEYSGRAQWLRRVLPTREGANAVGRLPARGERRRTVLLVAHHDAARTGLMWDPRFLAVGNRAAERSGKRASLALLPEIALGMAALGGRVPRAVAAALLLTATGLLVDVSRGPVVPGANDNASGVAAMLAALAELAVERPDGLEVIALAPGSEEAGMGGMSAWLGAHQQELDPENSLVIGLDTVGSGEPVVLEAEGGIWPVRYRREDVAHAERVGASVGVNLRRWRLGAWTDPVLARLAGLPTVSILSVRDGGFPNYHLPSDTPERVDYDCVERCVRAAVAIARA